MCAASQCVSWPPRQVQLKQQFCQCSMPSQDVTRCHFSADEAKRRRRRGTVFPELTPVLQTLQSSPEFITDGSMSVVERFVVLLYDRTSNLMKVNDARQELFSKKSRQLDGIPPTRAALEQHVRRAVFQGGYVWGQTLHPKQVLPSPSEWGWKCQNNRWSPYWTALAQAKNICYELISERIGYIKTACLAK